MKDTDINVNFQYLGFRWGRRGGGWVLRNICTLYAPQKEETQSPTYQKSMENPVLGERNSILNRVLKLDNSNFLNF